MIHIPNFPIDPQRERRDMDHQARQALQDVNDFLLGKASAHLTSIALQMFVTALIRYERDFEIQAEHTNTEALLLEKLAAQMHLSWSHWMTYLFSKSSQQADGSVCIPAELVDRWQRQMGTLYSQLSEQEKASDREQATLLLPLIRQAVNG